MIRKNLTLLCFGLIFIVSGNFFGALLISDVKTNNNIVSETNSSEEFFSDEEAITKEDVSISTIGSIDFIIQSIDQVIEKIQASSDDCWKKPASNRKDTMIKKLTVLRELVSYINLEDAYEKLLHDIKPKLTGLKTDENEDPWGNGEFKNPWVICADLNEEFMSDCNEILSQIKDFNQLH